jgi:hypothetical protein
MNNKKGYNLKTGKFIKCGTCGIKKYKSPSHLSKNTQYCSKSCSSTATKNGKFSKGIKRLSDDKHPHWKGDSAGKISIHNWIERKYGTPKICQHCFRKDKKKYEWANRGHTYKRFNREDWLRLCTSCHRQFDLGKIIIKLK